MVEENSGVKQVKAEPDQLQTLAQDKMVVKESGFLYIYTSNESPQDVFFDNVILDHITGPVLEETHYYPYGLTMSGISSKAAGKLGNKIKFNGYEEQREEFADGSGLEWYDYKNRFYDNQLGRFFCVDRLASDYPYYTPYQFAGNEVPNAIDLDGLEPYRFNILTGAVHQAGDNLSIGVAPGDYITGTGAASGAANRIAPVASILRDFIEPPLTALNTFVTGKTGDGREASFGDKVEAGAVIITSLPTKGGEGPNTGGMRRGGNLEPLPGRKGAFNEAKADAGVPRNQHPDANPETGKQYDMVPMTDRNGKAVLNSQGKPIMTREFRFTTADGSIMVIQEHSAGHKFNQGGVGDQGPHFNVRPSNDVRNGKVEGTQEHYPYKKR